MLERDRQYEANFEYKAAASEQEEGDGAKAGSKRLMRKYFTPTEANWGPKPRATGGTKKAKKQEETEK